jgi:hypothetical protein
MTTEKQKYGLYVLRRDGDHIIVLETENYDEVFALWKETKELWTTSIKEQKPFELTKPIVTAFDPGLISEVTIRPLIKASMNQNNPYVQKMQQDGFANTFNSVRGNSMLDNGYTY